MRKLILLILVCIYALAFYAEAQEKAAPLKITKGRAAVLEFYTSQG